jgi:hypothetical protein
MTIVLFCSPSGLKCAIVYALSAVKMQDKGNVIPVNSAMKVVERHGCKAVFILISTWKEYLAALSLGKVY